MTFVDRVAGRQTGCPKRQIVIQAAVLLASAAVIAAAWWLKVQDAEVVLPGWNLALPELCWFKRLTGGECPGCGLTRSVISLVHGHFAAAWQFNPTGLLVGGALAAQIPYRIMQIFRVWRGASPWRADRASSAAIWIAVVLMLANRLPEWRHFVM